MAYMRRIGTKKTAIERRTPIKRKAGYRIPKRAKNRAIQEKQYFEHREKFLKEGDGKCQMKTPVCTTEATCVHHTEGRIQNNLTDFSKCLRSCRSCNDWVETNDAAAREMGLKKSRLGPSSKRPKRNF